MWLGTVTTKEKKRGSKDRMSSKKNETTDDIWRKAERIMEAVPKKAPLIHCITNPISIHDCANVILAVGGRPIMAEHPEEHGDHGFRRRSWAEPGKYHRCEAYFDAAVRRRGGQAQDPGDPGSGGNRLQRVREGPLCGSFWK